MSIGSQTQTESAYLSSSVNSLHRAKKSTSEVSKTYKHASQLYLTRRLFECYEALQPVIRSSPKEENKTSHPTQSEDEFTPRAPIASASTSQRIKIWSLYATLLNTIVELGDEEGKQDFGNKLYRDLVRSVQSGDVWDQIVKDGYGGREASVDAEVVYNLSNLLLAQAPNQTINQSRLETYLSSSPHGDLDFSTAFQNGTHKRTNGMDTPKDLNSRVKILELFILHVLPRNNEWDYARSFVSNSDILDEERREAFLQTLNELQEVKEQEEAEAAAAAAEDLVGFADETDDETPQEGQIQMDDDDDSPLESHDIGQDIHDPPPPSYHPQSPSIKKSLHRRTSSEVDYGIEDDFRKSRTLQSQPQTHQQAQHPSGPPSQTRSTATTKATSSRTLSPPAPSPTPSITAPPPSTTTTSSAPSSQRPRPRKPTTKPPPSKQNQNQNPNKLPPSKPTNKPPSSFRLPRILRALATLTSSIARSLTRNPTQLFRTLMFLVAMLAVLARRDVRERLRRVVGVGWGKVMETAGMGVRVSYV